MWNPILKVVLKIVQISDKGSLKFSFIKTDVKWIFAMVVSVITTLVITCVFTKKTRNYDLNLCVITLLRAFFETSDHLPELRVTNCVTILIRSV